MTRSDPVNKDTVLVEYGTINNDTGVVRLGVDGMKDLLTLVAVGLKELKLTAKEKKEVVQPAKMRDVGFRLIANWVLTAEEIHIKIKPGEDLEKILKEMGKLNIEAQK
jgi:hypothetical protein